MSHAYNGLNDVCNISHLLFDNDDIEVYFKLYLLLYADDTVIFAETAAEFQSALNAMYLYCETWKLKVTTAKTNVVIFSKSRQNENIDFIYNNERLTVVDEFQYIGTNFSRKGNFDRSKARLVQQARKAMFYVRTDNTMAKRKRTKRQIMIYKNLHRKLYFEQYETHKKSS
jgi:hypothetical protein